MKNFYSNLTLLFLFIGLIFLACLFNKHQYFQKKEINPYLLSFLQGANSFTPIKKQYQETFSTDAEAILISSINNENKTLFKYNSEKQLPMASITKLMTAIIVIDSYNPKNNIKISNDITKTEGDPKKLISNETYSVKDLLYIMLIESNNEAAEALARKVDRTEFIKKMNQKAFLLDMRDTKYLNPTGLDLENGETNVTSAKDLEKLILHITNKYKSIPEILSNSKYTTYNQEGITRNSINTNILLSESKDFLWGKTGFTNKAKGCLVLISKPPNFSFFEKNYIINIIIGAKDRFDVARKLKTRIAKQFIW
ncbi:MAG: serine hydrolase [Candidatus Paceibacterota bacterium]|jgi:D-alanyl-D-alanine carboxypeptidase|nr:serine hydrolase [bacterium]